MCLINRLIISMLFLALAACEDSSSAQTTAAATTMVQQEETVSGDSQEEGPPVLSESGASGEITGRCGSKDGGQGIRGALDWRP